MPLLFLMPLSINARIYKPKIKLITPALITFITIFSKSKVTKNNFNLQELSPKNRKLQNLFHQIFSVYNTFTVGMKTNNLVLVSGCFIRCFIR